MAVKPPGIYCGPTYMDHDAERRGERCEKLADCGDFCGLYLVRLSHGVRRTFKCKECIRDEEKGKQQQEAEDA